MKNNAFFVFQFLFLFLISFKLSAQNQVVTITSKVNDDKSVDLNYEKKVPGTYTVNIELSNVSNCDVTSYEGIVTGYSGTVTRLRPTDKSRGIGYAIRYSTIMGEINPKVDSLFHYTLPFKNGKKIKVYEAGNIGEKFLGQEKVSNWKSYVVHPEKADTICSMRKGIVVLVKNEYDNNPNLKVHYTSMRNLITVEHADGTYATYKGFKKNGIFVKLGQNVDPQTNLGIVELYDNEGYRLDFSVYYLSGNIFKTEKVSIKNQKSSFKFITPVFVTQEGDVTIEAKKEYTVLSNEAVITKEFSRSEKKKYAKEHALSK